MIQKSLPSEFIIDKNPLFTLKFRALNFEFGKLVIPLVLPQVNCLIFQQKIFQFL